MHSPSFSAGVAAIAAFLMVPSAVNAIAIGTENPLHSVPNSWIVVYTPNASLASHEAFLDNHINENFVPVAGAPQQEPEMFHLHPVMEDGTEGLSLPSYLITGVSEHFAMAIGMDKSSVALVQPNVIYRAQTLQPKASFDLQQVSGQAAGSGTYAYAHNGGAGVTVYVLDSGITVTHPDFNGRARWGIALTDNGTELDILGHGTHVAGLIGSATYGVAKNASLVAVKVLDMNGMGSSASLIQGINWAIKDAEANADAMGMGAVINLSSVGAKDMALELAVSQAVAAGIPVVVAAGANVASAGTTAMGDSCLLSPAGSSAAFTVAAANPDGTFATWSNGGACVDAIAPGANVTSLSNVGVGTKMFSGTSVAAPKAAGIMAVLMSQARFGSTFEVYDVVKRMAMNGGMTVSGLPAGTVNKMVFNGAQMGIAADPGPGATGTTAIAAPTQTMAPELQNFAVLASALPKTMRTQGWVEGFNAALASPTPASTTAVPIPPVLPTPVVAATVPAITAVRPPPNADEINLAVELLKAAAVRKAGPAPARMQLDTSATAAPASLPKSAAV
ncbi:subtilisin-like serine protease, partial [Irineochytrium annulatum]